ncbi:unnamed protein product [Alopecurus aequalis]
MAAASHPDGGTKTQREDEDGEEGQPGAEDRISALPEELRLHVLGLLPLKPAIRTGALSTQWRELWTRRWPAPSSLDFFLAACDSPHPFLETLERRGLRRLDRFALAFGIGELEAEHFRRCLDYAAACAVEDLRVHFAGQTFPSFVFQFRLPLDDPHLTRLSLRGITVGNSLHPCTFSALEVIHLHRVFLTDITALFLVSGCPLLRTLDLRYCAGVKFLNIVGAGAHLRSLTVAECKPLTDISANGASSLRSFRYSGAYVSAYSIPATSTLADLCICFRRPGASCHGLRRNWLEQLTNLSSLSVLTLCNNALRRVSARARARSVARNAAPCKLHNLRELQLLMSAMCNENLDDIYVFLINCCGPRLERLFVQLPTRGYQCATKKELSGSESSEEDEPAEELSVGEPPEKAELEEEPSEGKAPEEGRLQEELSEGEAPEEDELQEDLSEGEEEDELSEGEEEDELEDELSEGEAPEEDELEEQLSEGEAPEEDELDEAQSEAFENLMLLKMINFRGRGNEMRLVRLVLKKSTHLSQLILFTPESYHPKGLKKDHMNIPQFIETKLLPLGKASPNAQIILSERNDSAIQPLHCEDFVKVK